MCSSLENTNIEFHYCRSFDYNPVKNDWVGCYGTNPNHGTSFEEARDELVKFCKIQYDFEKDYDDKIADEWKKKIDYYENITYNKWYNKRDGLGI